MAEPQIPRDPGWWVGGKVERGEGFGGEASVQGIPEDTSGPIISRSRHSTSVPSSGLALPHSTQQLGGSFQGTDLLKVPVTSCWPHNTAQMHKAALPPVPYLPPGPHSSTCCFL